MSDRELLDRLFAKTSAKSRKWLCEQWAEVEQLTVADLPEDCLHPVTVIAAYARRVCDLELVDDYAALLARAEGVPTRGKAMHPDAVLLQVIVRSQTRNPPVEPAIAWYVQFGIDACYEELIGKYLEAEEENESDED